MLLRILFIILLLTMTVFTQTQPPIETGVSQTLAKWRAANYSDVRYRLNITLEKGAPLMTGDIEISVKLTDEGAKSDLILDWRTTQFANDKDKPFADVVKVNESVVKETVPNGVFDYQTNKEHLIVSKKYLKTGENIIQIKFASPIKTSGAAVTRYVDKEDNAEYIYSLFVPSDASTAFPVFDQPDLKARFKLQVDAPGYWRVISNTKGVAGRLDPMSAMSTYFEETKPISTYVFAFAAGDFAEVSEPSAVADGLTSQSGNSNKNPNVSNAKLQPPATAGGSDLSTKIYVRKSQAEKFKQHSAEIFRLNREGVKFLEDWFDYKFPFPKYDLVLIPEFPFRGMEHAGATFLREDSIIFPTEPTKNDFITRANLIFHEAAHQWFGDTVTMKWFDDLWLKEGFAEFMAYKTLEKVLPEYNAWKIFYERNKQAAYLTDVTRGTTPIYQEIPNLSSAKSAYGNIVYRKAPSFLKQAEFYLGEKEFQTAVRAFLRKHEFANAEWTDLVNEFAKAKTADEKNGEYYQNLSERDKEIYEDFIKLDINDWSQTWVKSPGMAAYIISQEVLEEPFELKHFVDIHTGSKARMYPMYFQQRSENYDWRQKISVIRVFGNGDRETATVNLGTMRYPNLPDEDAKPPKGFEFTTMGRNENDYEEWKKEWLAKKPLYVFPNYQDYGYGIFLLDDKSRAYVLANIQTEKDDFLRSMMWGSLWDSVRFYELAPEDYVELVIENLELSNRKRIPTSVDPRLDPKYVETFPETDESTISTLLNRVGTVMSYYLNDEQREKFAPRLEKALIEKMTLPWIPQGEKITAFRAFTNLASTTESRQMLKSLLNPEKGKAIKSEWEKSRSLPPLKAKDRFDIVTRLLILGDEDALQLLAELEKTNTDDAAKRYAYAARAGIATAENKAKYWKDFISNKEISESWIESAFAVWNTPRHAELTLPYLQKSLAELPNLKRSRKIFFVNGWLSAFTGGQKSEAALNIVNKFLEDNPNLDKDLQRKILENSDNLERAVKIRAKFSKAS